MHGTGVIYVTVTGRHYGWESTSDSCGLEIIKNRMGGMPMVSYEGCKSRGGVLGLYLLRLDYGDNGPFRSAHANSVISLVF